MAITPLPVPVPQTSDPANFNTRADAFMTALPTFATEANALQTDVNNNQILTANNTAIASAAAASATASVSVVLWVSGTTYTQGQQVFSPINFKTYRRSTNGAGTTDPSLDTSNWVLIYYAIYPYMQVREQQTSGTATSNANVTGSGAVSTTITSVINTIVTNTIGSATLVSNVITLPAGTYEFAVKQPVSMTSGGAKLTLYNSTDSAIALIGDGSSYGVQEALYLNATGRVTIAGTKAFIINISLKNAGGSYNFGFGTAVGFSGIAETYGQVDIWKVA